MPNISGLAQRLYNAKEAYLRPRGNTTGKISAADERNFADVLGSILEDIEAALVAGGGLEFVDNAGEPPAELGGPKTVALNTTTGDFWKKNDEGEWKLKYTLPVGGGGGAPFDADFVVSLSGGKTFGRFTSGQTVPANGKTANEVILLAAIEAIYPSYATASVGLGASASTDGEEGETVNLTLTGSFNRGDAGAFIRGGIKRGGVFIKDGDNNDYSTASPFSRTVSVVRSLAGESFQAVADYAAGQPKPVPPANTPDDRAPGIRNPNAPQAAETGLGSSVVTVAGRRKAFWGAAAADPATSDDVRALPGSQLVSGGFTIGLETGTTYRRFVVAVPAPLTLQTAIDTGNQNANVKPFYQLLALNQVNNAGGVARSYNVYEMTVSGPYNPGTTHVLTFA